VIKEGEASISEDYAWLLDNKWLDSPTAVGLFLGSVHFEVPKCVSEHVMSFWLWSYFSHYAVNALRA
jgi:hypothetical protein